MGSKIFSHGQWIWDQSDRLSRHYTLGARQNFSVSLVLLAKIRRGSHATLAITADAYYQVWLNGKVLGHGPAKSAEGERMVDEYDVVDGLQPAGNLLEFIVWNVSYGTMNYCVGKAGLIFELRLPGTIIASGRDTQVRCDRRYRRSTVRRWVMPCMEDFNAAAKGSTWQRAQVADKTETLLVRPVGLPAREPITPQRIIALDRVHFPDFYTSFRIKPYLASGGERLRFNEFQAPAFFITELISPTSRLRGIDLGNNRIYLREIGEVFDAENGVIEILFIGIREIAVR
jgi:alpha-L-rhamnosidase